MSQSLSLVSERTCRDDPVNSFTKTDLHEHLQSKGIKQVVLTGYMAHGGYSSPPFYCFPVSPLSRTLFG